MAQPIPLEIPPRNPRAELQSRLEHAPEEHAEAVLAAYEVLQQLQTGACWNLRAVCCQRATTFWKKLSTRLELRRRFAPYAIYSSGNTSLAASSRNHSRVSSKRFRKAWHTRPQSRKNQLAFSDCCAGFSPKTAFAASPQPQIFCKPLDGTFIRWRVRSRNREENLASTRGAVGMHNG
jgi:hypothetical protein